MPIYAYKCTICEHRFETRQRFSDEPLTDCPVCHGSIRRVINQVGVVFKGSGFYVTDNRNGKSNGKLNGTGRNKSEKESESKDSAEGTKTENNLSTTSNKPDTKSPGAAV